MDDDFDFTSALCRWGVTHERELPWRRCSDPFHVLVAELLLQRTASRKVEPVWRELVKRYPTPAQLRRARESTLRRLINPLGLPGRAATLRELARVLDVEFDGSVPSERDALLSLPGVGPYVASAVRCIAFHQPDVMVDTVTSRVAKRYFDIPGRANVPDRAVHHRLIGSLPSDPAAARTFNLALLDLAASVCRPAIPRCDSCPVAAGCASAGRRYGQSEWRQGVTVGI